LVETTACTKVRSMDPLRELHWEPLTAWVWASYSEHRSARKWGFYPDKHTLHHSYRTSMHPLQWSCHQHSSTRMCQSNLKTLPEVAHLYWSTSLSCMSRCKLFLSTMSTLDRNTPIAFHHYLKPQRYHIFHWLICRVYSIPVELKDWKQLTTLEHGPRQLLWNRSQDRP
jgi:hypothetical protein